MTDIDAAATAKAERATQLVANADLRIQIVQREINHVLGLGRDHVQLADFGAALVIAALDSFDDSDTKALVETATRLGHGIGRAEALKEIGDEVSLSHGWQLDDPRMGYVDVQIDKDTYRQLMAAREIATKEPK